MNTPEILAREYRQRFGRIEQHRYEVWKILVDEFFVRILPAPLESILDLGCGWGEFINQVDAPRRYGMDLNPDTAPRLDPGVSLIQQDCSQTWALDNRSLDCVFTSNFFEHLPEKSSLLNTLEQAYRCLKPRGRLIAMGPNIRAIPNLYWDFFDHLLPLSDRSIQEALELVGFSVIRRTPRFLPFTMHGKRPSPKALIRLYLKLPFAWPLFGHQFLVVAEKPD